MTFLFVAACAVFPWLGSCPWDQWNERASAAGVGIASAREFVRTVTGPSPTARAAGLADGKDEPYRAAALIWFR